MAGILYGKAIPVLSGIDVRVFARTKTRTKKRAIAGLVASVDGGAAKVVLTG